MIEQKKMPPVEGLGIQKLIEAIERYDFECQGGPLRNCVEWRELQRRLGVEPVPNDSSKLM